METVIRNGIMKPRLTGIKIAALTLALMVHAVSLGLIAAGCYLLIKHYTHVPLLIIGVICILAAWLARPRTYKPKNTLLSREQFPILYQIVDEIASAMNAYPVSEIYIDEDYNAFFANAGFKRRNILGLGMPLILSLNKQELVAVIAHELAHGINGDSNRGFVLNSAIRTLVVRTFVR